jgi:hypothetical protein
MMKSKAHISLDVGDQMKFRMGITNLDAFGFFCKYARLAKASAFFSK